MQSGATEAARAAAAALPAKSFVCAHQPEASSGLGRAVSYVRPARRALQGFCVAALRRTTSSGRRSNPWIRTKTKAVRTSFHPPRQRPQRLASSSFVGRQNLDQPYPLMRTCSNLPTQAAVPAGAAASPSSSTALAGIGRPWAPHVVRARLSSSSGRAEAAGPGRPATAAAAVGAAGQLGGGGLSGSIVGGGTFGKQTSGEQRWAAANGRQGQGQGQRQWRERSFGRSAAKQHGQAAGGAAAAAAASARGSSAATQRSRGAQLRRSVGCGHLEQSRYSRQRRANSSDFAAAAAAAAAAGSTLPSLCRSLSSSSTSSPWMTGTPAPAAQPIRGKCHMLRAQSLPHARSTGSFAVKDATSPAAAAADTTGMGQAAAASHSKAWVCNSSSSSRLSLEGPSVEAPEVKQHGMSRRLLMYTAAVGMVPVPSLPPPPLLPASLSSTLSPLLPSLSTSATLPSSQLSTSASTLRKRSALPPMQPPRLMHGLSVLCGPAEPPPTVEGPPAATPNQGGLHQEVSHKSELGDKRREIPGGSSSSSSSSRNLGSVNKSQPLSAAASAAAAADDMLMSSLQGGLAGGFATGAVHVDGFVVSGRQISSSQSLPKAEQQAQSARRAPMLKDLLGKQQQLGRVALLRGAAVALRLQRRVKLPSLPSNMATSLFLAASSPLPPIHSLTSSLHALSSLLSSLPLPSGLLLLNLLAAVYGTSSVAAKLMEDHQADSMPLPESLKALVRFSAAALVFAPVTGQVLKALYCSPNQADAESTAGSSSSSSRPDSSAASAASASSSNSNSSEEKGGSARATRDGIAAAAAAAATSSSAAAAASASASASASARAALYGGVELGLWSFLATFCLAVAVNNSSSSASLLYSFSVFFIPAVEVASGRRLQTSTWIAILAALLGMGLLEIESEGWRSLPHPHASDLWGIAGSVFSAIQIFRSEALCSSTSPLSLTAVQLTTLAALCSLWEACYVVSSGTAVGAVALQLADMPWGPLLYGGLVCSGLCSWMELSGLKSVHASTAMLVYTTIPIWGAFFQFLVRGEAPGAAAMLGGAVILGASIAAQVVSPKQPAAAAAAGQAGGEGGGAAAATAAAGVAELNVAEGDGSPGVGLGDGLGEESEASEGREEGEGMEGKSASDIIVEQVPAALVTSQLKFPFYAVQAKRLLVEVKMKMMGLKMSIASLPASLLPHMAPSPSASSLPAASLSSSAAPSAAGASAVSSFGSSAASLPNPTAVVTPAPIPAATPAITPTPTISPPSLPTAATAGNPNTTTITSVPTNTLLHSTPSSAPPPPLDASHPLIAFPPPASDASHSLAAPSLPTALDSSHPSASAAAAVPAADPTSHASTTAIPIPTVDSSSHSSLPIPTSPADTSSHSSALPPTITDHVHSSLSLVSYHPPSHAGQLAEGAVRGVHVVATSAAGQLAGAGAGGMAGLSTTAAISSAPAASMATTSASVSPTDAVSSAAAFVVSSTAHAAEGAAASLTSLLSSVAETSTAAALLPVTEAAEVASGACGFSDVGGLATAAQETMGGLALDGGSVLADAAGSATLAADVAGSAVVSGISQAANVVEEVVGERMVLTAVSNVRDSVAELLGGVSKLAGRVEDVSGTASLAVHGGVNLVDMAANLVSASATHLGPLATVADTVHQLGGPATFL